MILKQAEAKNDEIRAAEDEKKKVLTITLSVIYTLLSKCFLRTAAGAAEEEGKGKSKKSGRQGLRLGGRLRGPRRCQPGDHPRQQQQVCLRLWRISFHFPYLCHDFLSHGTNSSKLAAMGSSSSGSAGASNDSAKAGTKAVIEVVDPEQRKILEAERMAQQLIEVRRALFLAYVYMWVCMYVACVNHRHGVVTTYYC